MVLPALLVGAEAIRSNVLERRALQALGESMSRTRTYAELETAMFDQSEMVWRHLSGLDPTARNEFKLTGRGGGLLAAALAGRAPARGDGHGGRRRRHPAADRAGWPTASSRSPTPGSEIRLPARAARAERAAPARPHGHEPRDLPPGPRIECPGRLQPPGGDSQRQGRTPGRHHRPRPRGGPGGLVAHLPRARPARSRAHGGHGRGGLRAAGTPDRRDVARRDRRPGPRLRTHDAELNDSRAQVVQAEKLASIGEMSAAVAHGLRNPLASLRAAAQLVRHHPASPSAAEHLDAILEEVDRLDRRISHLLSFSRPAPFHPMPESLSAPGGRHPAGRRPAAPGAPAST